MIAYQAISGGVAEILVELGRALQVGEHDCDTADSDVVAGTQKLLGAQAPERRHSNDTFAGERVHGPVAILDDKKERSISVVTNDELILAARRQNNIAAARRYFRDHAVRTDGDVGLGARFHGAETMRAGRQRQRKAACANRQRPRLESGHAA